MSQSMRIKQGMSTFLYRIGSIAFHQAKPFQPFYHHTGRQFIYIHIRDARTKCFHRLQMHCVLHLVHFTLTNSEFLIGRNSRWHITGISRFYLCTGINQKQITRFHFIPVIMVVQCLSVNCSNCGKGQFTIICLRYPIHFCHHFIFIHPRTKNSHSSNMHIGSNITRLFYFDYFFGRFIIPLGYYGTDKWDRAFLTRRRYAQPVHQLQFMLGTIRG